MLTCQIKNNHVDFYDGPNQILSIEETEVEGGVLMALQGELRSEAGLFLQDELDAFTSTGVKVAVDFAGVTYIAPTTVYALLNAQQLIDNLMQGEIFLRNVPNSVYQEMDEAGVAELLLIED